MERCTGNSEQAWIERVGVGEERVYVAVSEE
jgi:hypothetical protein